MDGNHIYTITPTDHHNPHPDPQPLSTTLTSTGHCTQLTNLQPTLLLHSSHLPTPIKNAWMHGGAYLPTHTNSHQSTNPFTPYSPQDPWRRGRADLPTHHTTHPFTHTHPQDLWRAWASRSPKTPYHPPIHPYSPPGSMKAWASRCKAHPAPVVHMICEYNSMCSILFYNSITKIGIFFRLISLTDRHQTDRHTHTRICLNDCAKQVGVS